MTEKASAYVASLGLEYKAEFVPQSKSRNAGEDTPSLNWRVTIAKDGAKLETDYMQGCAHLPHYSHAFAHRAAYDAAVREACETGRSRLIGGLVISRERAVPAPDLADVLYRLVMDASVLDFATFEDWAAYYGYDTDSRRAEATYRACLDTALKLRQILNLDEAREAFEESPPMGLTRPPQWGSMGTVDRDNTVDRRGE